MTSNCIGNIHTFDSARQKGTIKGDDGRVLRFKQSDLSIIGLPIGTPVQFDVVEDETGTSAGNVRPIDQRYYSTEQVRARVAFWDSSKRFGFAIPPGTDLRILLTRSTWTNQVADPVIGQLANITYVLDEVQAKTHALEVHFDTPLKPEETPLVTTEILGMGWQEKLASIAEPENWDHLRKPTHAMPILTAYLKYTEVRLREEGKVLQNAPMQTAAFNTGLVTALQEEIFAFFSTRTNPWKFLGFRKESDQQLMNSFVGTTTPQLASYFDDPSALLYDRNLELVIDKEHILNDNFDRFPKSMQSNLHLTRQLLAAAETTARKRVHRNYKAAIPQWYRNGKNGRTGLQLLLPLCLEGPTRADLALVVERKGNAYRGNTVLTLDMAYANARLIAKPDTDWLIP